MSANKRPGSSDDESTSRPKRIKPTDTDESICICSICLNPMTLSGRHAIVATKCGHIFGDSCLRSWLSACAMRLRSCPTCKARAVSTEIRRIYSNNIVVIDGQSDDELIELKKKLNKLQNEMAMLKTLGVEYCECSICDMSFMNVAQKIKHNIKCHTLNDSSD